MTKEIPYNCVKCGKPEAANYMEHVRVEMIRDKLCFSCHFWTDWLKLKDDPNVFRYKGKHFKTAPESQGGFRGYGGAKFTIVTSMGEEIVTTNLWHQGTIPDHFKAELPDNCVIIGIA